MAKQPKRLTNADRVLAYLSGQGKPQSAYQILDGLRGEGIAAPVTVYRALDRLVAAGKAHRLESMSAYVACNDHHPHGLPVFAICDDCGTVSEEVDSRFASDVTAIAGRLDFEPRDSVIEIRGRCGPCRNASGT